MTTTVTFGELMARLAAPGHQRLEQGLPGNLEVTFAGAEANVAVTVARLGLPARCATALPSNPLGHAALAELRRHGVDTSAVKLVPDQRLGLYFLEIGANQRASRVIYDRDHSAFAQTDPEAWDLATIFADAGWFHFTGITPAVSAPAAAASQRLVKEAAARQLPISCDLNFRAKLWRWDPDRSPRELARVTMEQLLPYVTVLIANEADAADVLGIAAEGTRVEHGEINREAYTAVAREICTRFPQIERVAITLRESISATHNNWSALLYNRATGRTHLAPATPYEIRGLVDRVGAGDAFAGALIRALQDSSRRDDEEALAFATAAACLAHSFPGDFNYAEPSEIRKLAVGHASGRVER